MDTDRLILNIVDDGQIDEGLGKLVSFAILSSVLSMAGIVEGATFEKNIQKLANNSPKSTLTITKNELGKVVEKSKKKDTDQKVGKYTRSQIRNILTRTIWMEAREDGKEGMTMVMTSIWNRAGKVLSGVVDECFQNLQFSCWNKVDGSIKTPEGYSIHFPKSVLGGSGADATTWKIASDIVDSVMNGTFKSVNDSWTSYYNPDKANPSWKSDLKGTQKVGHHLVGSEQWRLNQANKKANKVNTQVVAKYTVKKGDSLWSIAKKNNLKVDQIKTINGLKGDSISPGQVLKLA